MSNKKFMSPFIIWAFASISFGVIASAKTPTLPSFKQSLQRKVLIDAGSIDVDQSQQIVTASGLVKIILNEHGQFSQLTADKLIYDQNKDKLIAWGHVAYITSSQEVLFSNQVELTDNLKKIVGEEFKLILQDESRFAAVKGKKTPDGFLVLEKAAYTPCRTCHLKQGDSPFWQMKAEQVIHDESAQVISYRNVRLELLGVPIFYTPYFWHPDPTVKRKSGLLAPIYSSSKNFGFLIGIPYYQVIDEHSDLTVTPVFTSKQGPLLTAELRHAFPIGFIGLQGSATHTKKLNQSFNPDHLKPIKKDRWHFYGTSRTELTPNQLLTIDVQRASDTTYLRSYSVLNKAPHSVRSKNLTSSVNWEHYGTRSYSTVQAYDYQTDFTKTTPLVAPYAWHRFESDPGLYGIITSLDANAYGLFRQKPMIGHGAQDNQRIVVNPGLDLPIQTEQGHLFNFSGNAIGRFYKIKKYQRDTKTRLTTGERADLSPQLQASWRYPLIRMMENIKWVLEPIIKFFSTSGHQKSKKIPNEDSLYPNVSDFNVMKSNRFDGYDRLDFGQRLAYGINNDFYDRKNNHLGIFLGHSLHFNRQGGCFNKNTGERKSSSDLVGRISFRPTSWVKGQVRFSQPTDLRRTRTTEFSGEFGKPILKLNLSYIFFAPKSTYDNKGISQVIYKLTSDLTKDWTIGLGQTLDFKKSNGSRRALSQFAHLDFHNDCFVLSTVVYKTSYRDRDLRPDTGILLQLSFKNLGNFNFGHAGGYIQNTERYFKNTHQI